MAKRESGEREPSREITLSDEVAVKLGEALILDGQLLNPEELLPALTKALSDKHFVDKVMQAMGDKYSEIREKMGPDEGVSIE